MRKLEIKDVTKRNIDELVNFCIPPNRKEDKFFIKGARVKSEWASEIMKKYGSNAKLAYIDSKPMGMIQYLPKPEEKIVDINCIFVPIEFRIS